MNLLLEVSQLKLAYQQQVIVNDLSFHINDGDICSLLGPSGCGKTTTLRAIAGFENPLGGEIRLDGRLLSTATEQLPPEQRQIGMVFQDYALFPHLTIYENIAFGIKQKRNKGAIVKRLLEMVNLPGMDRRYPHELSGGQQQRVALARAMAPEPRLLLLDEPFSNLDVDLRRRLSQEVREILKEQKISAILVTHDQEEAFAFSDKVGVIKEGNLLQWDTPYELYHEPNSPFVANFIGQGHFIRGQMNDAESITTELGLLAGNRVFNWPEGTPVEVLLRPDDIVLDETSDCIATVVRKTFMGAVSQYQLQLPTGSVIESLIPSHHDLKLGDRTGIRVEADHLVVFATPTDGNPEFFRTYRES
ncbi:ABC transporter ATP-binding protein [Aestuariirhabdus litorea]|uniref:ABC transporter ATP-binding protein n=1 Tax=Aestuariirhabdus litorea TaxID=2528527 RepID=A0A3P3VR37_9GAMM|nr:ABC transporter ATP-binding protein [Aestuariirhabdus litorea]RRJ84136.1 ABC transporter ATP-binding protein [Aestuariirhabdus litorea]RWW97356.1 ATP-binding cassette domain-containing protein [Endozoicomonadaceae bacterium GTF-13]